MNTSSLNRNVIAQAIAVLALSFIFLTPAVAESFFTDFEFNDTSGQFSITDGDPVVTASFTGGRVETLGDLDLYHSGVSAWMMGSGTTGTISLASPVQSISLWLRDDPDAAAATTVQIFDANNNLLASFSGTHSEWTNITHEIAGGGEGISVVSIQNTGTNGLNSVDDLTINGLSVNTGLENPIPTPISRGVPIKLETIVTGLTAPNWGIFSPKLNGNVLYVSDQVGIVYAIDLLTKTKRVFLDVASRLVPLGIDGPDSFDERGLLGIAFHPEYPKNGLLYTYTSEAANHTADFPAPGGAAEDHQSVIAEWRVPQPGNPSSNVDASSARVLMRIGQPQFNHNGGALVFGPDKMLYISLGDGGNADDEGDGHGTIGNGQDPSNLLGDILRIDPAGNNSANGKYGIPVDNPFVSQPGFLPEIFAWGFRNPFRISFDRRTGRLFAADVGQNDIEEVDIVTAGNNYGWNFKEGTFFFEGNGDGAGFVTDIDPGVPSGLIDPVIQYDHDEGIAIIGGFVYRGNDIPGLRGRYLFGDYARTFASDGRLFYSVGQNDLREFRLAGQSELGLFLLGFGQDSAGEIYVLANEVGIPFGTTGTVLKITPAQTISSAIKDNK